MLSRYQGLLFALLALAATGHLLLASGGLPRTVALREDHERIEKANERLRAENERLRRELKALADDPAELERAAREELGLVKPGEVVFRLEDGDEAARP